VLLIIVEFYLSVWPLGGKPTAKGFFANYVSVVAIIVIYIGSMIYYKGPLLNDARSIDLDQFRRFYVDPRDEEAKAEKTGVKKYLSKGIGFVFN
jgi:amino acid transporter